MSWSEIRGRVVAQFTGVPLIERADSLGSAGGFSGARFWRLDTPAGALCLRAWPEELRDSERLAWIHRVQQHLTDQGCDCIPRLLTTGEGDTFVAWRGKYWEISGWMPGNADYCRAPSHRRLSAAMETLAHVHSVLATCPHVAVGMGPSPALQQRMQMVDELDRGGLDRLLNAVHRSDASCLSSVAKDVLRLYGQAKSPVARQARAVMNEVLPLQVVLRDVWHDHLLFTGDQVSGLVDFGAMSVDSVSLDVARLVGSLVGDHAENWQIGIDSFCSIRRLTDQERRIIAVFDRTAILLSGVNWLRWIFLDGRQFESLDVVQARLEAIACRLEALAGSWGRHFSN